MIPESFEHSPFPPIDPPGIDAAELRADVDSIHADCAAVLESLIQPIRAAVVDCVSQCSRENLDCVGCLSGSVLRVIDSAGATATKCSDRVINYAISLLHEAYARAEPIIGPPPDAATVAADLFGVPPPPAPPQFVDPPVTPPPTTGDDERPPYDWEPVEWCYNPKCPHNPDDLNEIFPPLINPRGQSVCPPGYGLFRYPDGRTVCREQCCPSSDPPPPTIDPPPTWGGPPPTIGPPIQIDPPAAKCAPPPCAPPVAYEECQKTPVPPPPCPVLDAKGDPLQLPDYSRRNVCDWLDDNRHRGSTKAGQLSRFLGFRTVKDGEPAFPEWMEYGVAGQLPFLKPIIAQLGAWGCDAAEYLVERLPAPASCDAEGALVPRLASIALGFAERWVGDGFSPLQTTLEYWSNYHCPTNIPDSETATDLWNRGYIDRKTWECLVRSNGQFPTWQEDIANVMQGAVTPLEFVTLQRRGVIGRPYAELRIQQTTGTDPEEIPWYWELSKYIPNPGDLISFMMRDVFDQDIINKYKLDDEFEKKFTGDAVNWANGQGIDEKVMRYYWRAHWDWPSPTQLYLMLHRLYPGSPVLTPGVEPVVPADVEQVLGVNDVIPVWRKRLVAVSYNPMTRVDTRRAYCMDVLTEEDVYHNLRAIGYDERTARIMTEYYKKDKQKGCLTEPQYLGWKTIIGYYVNGLASWDETTSELIQLGMSGDKITRWMKQAEYARNIKRRNVLQKAVKRSFSLGDIDRASAVARLVTLGIPPVHAADTVDTWSSAKRAQGKLASAAQLCKWKDKGLLDDSEYLVRLIAAGWTRKDAERIVSECQMDIDEKQAKAAAAAAEKERKELEKRQKEREKQKNGKAKSE